MKKMLFVLLAGMLFSMNTFAFDWSIGAVTPGVGPVFTRGADKGASGAKGTLGFSPAFAVSAQVDFVPFWSLEIDAGYGFRSFTTVVDGNSRENILGQIQVPVYIRTQYTFADVVTCYFLVGPKFICNVQSYDGSSLKNLDTSRYTMFGLDVSLGLGAEFRLGSAHWLGLRITDDVNVIGSYKNGGGDVASLFADTLGVSVTYRYVFGK